MPAWGGVLPQTAIEALAGLVVARNSTAAADGARPTSPQSAEPTAVRGELHAFRIETIVEDSLDRPSSIAVLPDGQLLVADARGLRQSNERRSLSAPVVGLPPMDALQDVAVHPDHATNRWLYLTYVCSAACGHPDRHVYSLARGRLRGGRWLDAQLLATFGDGDSSYGNSKIAFDGRGHVFYTLSGAERPGLDPADFAAQIAKPQQLASARGKVFRLHDDGRVPADNPFVGRPDALAAIWSYGHRGISGLHYDRNGGVLWATEHGPWGGDELNRIERGGNYGWPLVSSGYHYAGAPIESGTREGLIPPVFHWTPSVGVSNVVVYDGAAFPRWRGHLLVGSLGARIGRTLFRFELDGPRARLYAYPTDAAGRVLRDAAGNARPRVARFEEVAPDAGRIRDLRVGPEGYVYLLLEHPARVVRLVPTPVAAPDA
jgi:glucose/arabinose dehydrogenase